MQLKKGLTEREDEIISALQEDLHKPPHDIEENYYSNRGAIYGVVSDRKKNKGFKAPKQSQLFSNLFFTGDSVNPGGGMPMVVLSGQQVADMVKDRKK